MRSLPALLLLLTASALSACSSETPNAEVPAVGTEGPLTIEVSIEGDSVQPNGDRVSVSAGQTIEFDVTSDRAAALHVHSTPEQTLDFGVGTTQLSLTLEQPGVVEVETSDTDTVVVQLEVE